MNNQNTLFKVPTQDEAEGLSSNYWVDPTIYPSIPYPGINVPQPISNPYYTSTTYNPIEPQIEDLRNQIDELKEDNMNLKDKCNQFEHMLVNMQCELNNLKYQLEKEKERKILNGEIKPDNINPDMFE